MESWLDGKTISCLGDSITQGVGNEDISWADYLTEHMSVNVQKYGVAGSTVSIAQGKTDSFVERVDQITDSDIILVFGGINDFNHGHPLGEENSTDPSTFFGALNSIICTLQNRFPEAEIVFITPMKASGFKGYPNWKEHNDAGYPLKAYRDAIITVAEHHSVFVIDLYAESGLTPDIPQIKKRMLPDGLHPSKSGYQKIARKISHALLYRL